VEQEQAAPAAAEPGGSWPARWYGRVYQVQDLLATRLALVFGFGWTIWIFFVIPLVAPYFSLTVQAKVFYYASGWVQLFALPLMIYVSNKIQKTTDGQAAAQAELLTRNTALTEESARLARLVNDGLARNSEIIRAVIAIRESQERHQDVVLERIEGIVTGNAELGRAVEGITTGNADMARGIREAVAGNAQLSRDNAELARHIGEVVTGHITTGNAELSRVIEALGQRRPPGRRRPPGDQGAPPG